MRQNLQSQLWLQRAHPNCRGIAPRLRKTSSKAATAHTKLNVPPRQDAAGNLVGKITIIPTVFGPDAIWINGRAYYDAPTQASTSVQLDDQPEPTGEVIDQSINGVPEKSGTPPDYKPDTTPPDDPNASVIP